jgi:hypothetical protein
LDPPNPTLYFIFVFLQTDLVRYRTSRRRTTGLVVPILEAPTHTSACDTLGPNPHAAVAAIMTTCQNTVLLT